MKKTIGERIRRLRQSRDYTQDNMAAELDITPGAYAKIERGETDPSATRLLRIAEILGVDVTSFFKDSAVASQVQQLAHQPYGAASKEELEQLTQLVRQLSQEIEKLKKQINTVPKPVRKGK